VCICSLFNSGVKGQAGCFVNRKFTRR
jgi:hypothetical protein